MLPAYTDRHEGPDHASKFHATVVVCGGQERDNEMGEVGSGVREALAYTDRREGPNHASTFHAALVLYGG